MKITGGFNLRGKYIKTAAALLGLLRSAALLACLAAPAAAELDDEAGDWEVFAPPPQDGPGRRPTTPEGGYSQPDRDRAEERRRARILDQLCRFVELKQDFRLEVDGFSGTGGALRRRLEAEPGGRLTLVDEQELRLSFGHGLSREFSAGASAGASISASVSGRSIVVRRLESSQTCDEVDRLIDLREIKTVVPFKGERISAMALGELWRVPLTLTIGYGVGTSRPLGENASASLSFGYSKNGAASVTVMRLAEDKVRFRFRIDYATVRSQALGAGRGLSAAEFLQGWQGALGRYIDNRTARDLAEILALNFGLSKAVSDGKRMILEHVIDPRDPAQAEALALALRGDFRRLLTAARRVATEHVSADEAGEAYGEVLEISADRLGAPFYLADDAYGYETGSFSLNAPFFSRVVSEVFGDSSISRKSGEAGEFRFHSSEKSPANEFLRLPFFGPLVKETDQRRVEVVTYAAKDRPQGEPLLVYMRSQGYLRVPGSAFAESVEEINSVLRLAGARRGGGGRRMELPRVVSPSSSFSPPSPELPYAATEAADREGSLSLTLVFNEKAVREAVSAAKEEVLGAFAASLGGPRRPLMDWLAANGRFTRGRLAYDENDAAAAFGQDALTDLSQLSRAAAGLVEDLVSVRAAEDNDQRARSLAKALGGRGRSGLGYDQVLKVLIQFMDPLDLTGDFVAAVRDMSKSGKDIEAHYILKKRRLEIPLLREAGEARSRFSEGSSLYD